MRGTTVKYPDSSPNQHGLHLGRFLMRKYKYFIGGLEDMADYIIRLADGQQINLEDATMKQVAGAISIIKVSQDLEASIKNP